MRGYSCEYCSGFARAEDTAGVSIFGHRAQPPDGWLTINDTDRAYHFCGYLCLAAYAQHTLRQDARNQ